MQTVSSRVWTRVAVSISYDDNHYTTGTSKNHYTTGTSKNHYTTGIRVTINGSESSMVTREGNEMQICIVEMKCFLSV